MKKKLAAIVGLAGIMLGIAGPALASTNPAFTSTFYYSVRLEGATHFTTPTAGVRAYVTVNPTGPYSDNYPIYVRVEVQTCGIWGCHWHGQYVGGTCTITPSSTVYAQKDCYFSAPASSQLHRLVFTKANNGEYYSGSVWVR
jgi:hypothetical protein